MSYGKRGLVVRLCYLGMSAAWWALHGFGRQGRDRAIVLCYHGVTGAQAARFAWQMSRIARWSVWPEQLWERDGAWRRKVCVTSDDGFANLLENAIPVCEAHGTRLTVFVVTRNLGEAPRWAMSAGHPEASERLMTEEELRRAAASEWVRIGSHTRTHPRLAASNDAALKEELKGSREDVRTMLGDETADLAFPHGSWDARVARAALEAGYERVFTLEHDAVDATSRETGVCGRFLASPEMWKAEFLLTVWGGYSWLGGWRRLMRSIRSGAKRGSAAA